MLLNIEQFDSESISNFQYRYVTAELNVVESRSCKRARLEGYLNSFDPITKSIILADISDDLQINNLKLIPGNRLKCIFTSEHDNRSDLPVIDVKRITDERLVSRLKDIQLVDRRTDESSFNIDNTLTKRLDALTNWLKSNHIEFRLDEKTKNILISDFICIKPPYKHHQDYIVPNRIVLTRVKKIVDNMPIDY